MAEEEEASENVQEIDKCHYYKLHDYLLSEFSRNKDWPSEVLGGTSMGSSCGIQKQNRKGSAMMTSQG
jgi:hypothetical protein